MGAYLSHPVTEKYSCEETLPDFSYGASSMQGWRMSQEDAHNCIPHFDTNTTLFAVYDGHGGAEVAQYCAINLPDYVKSVPTYKSGNMAQALEDAFLGFDETLTQPRVVSELKQMAGIFDQQSDTEENEVNHLFAEANMPIEEVLAKYNSGAGGNPQLTRLQEDKPQSPFLRAKKCLEEIEQMKKQKIALEEGIITGSDMDLKKCEDKSSDSLMVNGDKPHIEQDEKNAKQTGCDSPEQEMSGTKSKEISKDKSHDESEVTTTQNSETPTSTTEQKPTPSSSSADAHPGCSRDAAPGTSLGKRVPRAQGVSVATDSDDSSNTEDESYQEGIPYADETDSEDGDDDEIDQSGEKEDDDDEEEEEDSSESEDEEQEDEEDEDEEMLPSSEREKPGSDSGCTAVVALLRGSELYVANAGDSRCIVCRNGKAIDMSVDHKPEDELEMKRIINAGGKVEDGRVNGGLNLSRAIGDHTYKQNTAVAPKDQMISALPDIRTLTIDPEEDEFMVLACDGIWNYLSSQEVADFVSERLKRGTDKLSLICEELFDHCLAPHTGGDGTGCDNMTAIIVKFHKSFGQKTDSGKRTLEGRNGLDECEAKRMKPSDDGDTRPSAVE